MIDQIEKLSEERRKAIASGQSKEVQRLTGELDYLYDQQRRAKAEEQHGTRETIIKNARIQLELEKLTK